MKNLFDRTFVKMEEVPKKELPHGGSLNAENAVTMAAHIQEEIHMLDEVRKERERAIHEETIIHRIIKYKTVPVAFGGQWDTTKWPDSITVFRNEEELITIAIPPLAGSYDKEDVLDYGFIADGYQYYLHLSNNNERKQLRPTAIHVPVFDKNNYTIGVSTKLLPWEAVRQELNPIRQELTSVRQELASVRQELESVKQELENIQNNLQK